MDPSFVVRNPQMKNTRRVRVLYGVLLTVVAGTGYRTWIIEKNRDQMEGSPAILCRAVAK